MLKFSDLIRVARRLRKECQFTPFGCREEIEGAFAAWRYENRTNPVAAMTPQRLAYWVGLDLE